MILYVTLPSYVDILMEPTELGIFPTHTVQERNTVAHTYRQTTNIHEGI